MMLQPTEPYRPGHTIYLLQTFVFYLFAHWIRGLADTVSILGFNFPQSSPPVSSLCPSDSLVKKFINTVANLMHQTKPKTENVVGMHLPEKLLWTGHTCHVRSTRERPQPHKELKWLFSNTWDCHR